MRTIVYLIPLLCLTVACGDELVDDIDAACSDWIAETNDCLEELATVSGSEAKLVDEKEQCGPIVSAAEDSSTEDNEKALKAIECSTEAYAVDCSDIALATQAIIDSDACVADL